MGPGLRGGAVPGGGFGGGAFGSGSLPRGGGSLTPSVRRLDVSPRAGDVPGSPLRPQPRVQLSGAEEPHNAPDLADAARPGRDAEARSLPGEPGRASQHSMEPAFGGTSASPADARTREDISRPEGRPASARTPSSFADWSAIDASQDAAPRSRAESAKPRAGGSDSSGPEKGTVAADARSSPGLRRGSADPWAAIRNPRADDDTRTSQAGMTPRAGSGAGDPSTANDVRRIDPVPRAVTPGTAAAATAAVATSAARTSDLSDEPSVSPSGAGDPPSRIAAPAPVRPALPPPPPTPSVTAGGDSGVATSRGLFGLAPAPFVQGDFVAGVRLASGDWAVVQPTPEPFPNAWQRRVLLWFAIAAALVAPFGWLFSRRLVRPLSEFATAAERLGRDPHAVVLELEGPAEVGRAAHAFNRMQSRLRSFVDDRTAMIGAISHDLRTPLTRMRFRIEDLDDAAREGMLQEVDEMEHMINAVLAFIRDASEPGSREKLDLRTIVEDVVEDALFVGQAVELQHAEPAPVEVDAIGMRRLLGNLVENAVKYGERAEVRLFTDQQDAVAEVRDSGPGLSDAELERVFDPFYRSPSARASDKSGTGLGLAVCRSIARAHGGDVQLTRGDRGLVAQVRVPLAFEAVGV
ncbi:HAMP domain-containing protein [Schlegelella sp. ID0723]|uniref:histidine kinase n=2 Tax=Piscinibacter koreensis TaxID=2742824 RepID=A0A7Y6NRD0_9BURK|nr:HAMP domain-containing protein [Schlegelella koreensis]